MYSSHSLCCVQVHFTSLWLPLMPNVARSSFLVMETVWLAIPCLMRFRGTGKDYILFVVWAVPVHSFLFIWRFKGGPVIFGLLCASNRNVWVNLYILSSVMQAEQNEGNTRDGSCRSAWGWILGLQGSGTTTILPSNYSCMWKKLITQMSHTVDHNYDIGKIYFSLRISQKIHLLLKVSTVH